jgi:protoheme IX farnesyltransferase
VTAAQLTLARTRSSDFLDLTKPRLSALVLMTTFTGMAIAPGPLPALSVLLPTLLGTGAVIGAANALNCYFERDVDALMQRTRNRPLPAGRMAPGEALAFAALLAVTGLPILALFVSPLAAFLAALAFASYVFVYTPLKRRSPHATVIGAVPGAIPTLIGWAAATGRLDPGAWAFFAILFLWQPPHFLSLAWLHRDDYTRAGMPFLPVRHPDGRIVARQMLLWFSALLPLSLLLLPSSDAGIATLAGSTVLGAWLSARTLAGVVGEPDEAWARRCFHGSILYMAFFLLVLLLDAGGVLGRGL